MMAEQNESDDIFVTGVKDKEFKVTGSSVLLFLFHSKNKTDDLVTIGSFTFGVKIKMSSDLLCPTILILPHPIPDRIQEEMHDP